MENNERELVIAIRGKDGHFSKIFTGVIGSLDMLADAFVIAFEPDDRLDGMRRIVAALLETNEVNVSC